MTLAFVGSNPAIPAIQNNNNADVAKLADALDLGSSAERRGGSTPFICTRKKLFVKAKSFFVVTTIQFGFYGFINRKRKKQR